MARTLLSQEGEKELLPLFSPSHFKNEKKNKNMKKLKSAKKNTNWNNWFRRVGRIPSERWSDKEINKDRRRDRFFISEKRYYRGHRRKRRNNGGGS